MQLGKNLSLAKKIGLLTTLVLLAAVAAFGFLAMRAVNQATEAMLQDRMTTAHLVADYLDEMLARALSELDQTARLVAVNQPASAAPLISTLEQTYSRLSISTEGVYLLSPEGRVVWSARQIVPTGQDLSRYPGISQALAGKGSISPEVGAPESGVPVILLSSPTSSQGAIVVAVNLARSGMGGFIHPIQLGQTGYVEVVDQNGVVVLRTDPGPELAPFEKSDHSGHFAQLIAAGQPARGLCHTCHEPVQKVEARDLLAFVPLSQTQWGVVVRQAEDEALAPIRELQRNLLIYGAGLIAIALLFVGLTSRDIVGQIRLLTGASRRIAAGNLSVPVKATRNDEIGVLAQSFEDMRKKLQDSYGELEHRTGELLSLLSVSEILSASGLSNLDSALDTALDKTLAIMKTDVGGILLAGEDSLLRYHVHRGLSERFIKGIRLKPGEGISGKVAQSGGTIRVADISSDPRAAGSDLVKEEGLRAFASVPLQSERGVLGALSIASRGSRQFSEQDVRLLEGIARQIGTAIENARLHREVQRKDKLRGELLRQVLSIQEEERRRIARELHDETCQVLASLSANLEAASGMLPPDSNGAKEQLRKAQTLSISTLEEMHRIIYELRPSLLDDLGLVTAVKWLVENNLQPAGVKVSFRTVGKVKRLPPSLENILFRVIQEAVNNIVRHAGAKNAEIRLRFKRGSVEVYVKDDGTGFDVEEALSLKERPRGLGLLGMKERVDIAAGTLKLKSSPGGGGTQLDIIIPLPQEVTDGENKITGR